MKPLTWQFQTEIHFLVRVNILKPVVLSSHDFKTYEIVRKFPSIITAVDVYFVHRNLGFYKIYITKFITCKISNRFSKKLHSFEELVFH